MESTRDQNSNPPKECFRKAPIFSILHAQVSLLLVPCPQAHVQLLLSQPEREIQDGRVIALERSVDTRELKLPLG